MSQAKKKVVGEGGAHAHRLSTPEMTEADGMHKHLFFVNERLVMTDLDGAHTHPVTPSTNEVGAESEPRHKHKVSLNTQDGVQVFETSAGTPHPHELQVENTTISGLHTHTLELGGETFVSLLPGDLIEEVEEAAKSVPGLKGMKLKRAAGPLEFDFALVKRLNKADFGPIVKRAATSALLKSLSRLHDGMRIQSLILSKERFSDIGQARRFVMDHSLNIRASEDREGIFSFMVLSQDEFQEATLQRVRVTEGVEAIVGFLRDDELAGAVSDENPVTDSLTENAVESSREPEMRQDTIDSAQDQPIALASLKEKLKAISSVYEDDQCSAPKTKTDTLITKSLYCPIVKQDTERRLVTGPVLIPEKLDLQNEVISAEEIERAAHNFMLKLAFNSDPEFLSKIGLNDRAEDGFMHVDFDRRIGIVESYIAPVDFMFNGRKVLKGTWVNTVKVFDNEIWNLIKAGKVTGFSIGGRARLIDDVAKSYEFFPQFNEIKWEAA